MAASQATEIGLCLSKVPARASQQLHRHAGEPQDSLTVASQPALPPAAPVPGPSNASSSRQLPAGASPTAALPSGRQIGTASSRPEAPLDKEALAALPGTLSAMFAQHSTASLRNIRCGWEWTR